MSRHASDRRGGGSQERAGSAPGARARTSVRRRRSAVAMGCARWKIFHELSAVLPKRAGWVSAAATCLRAGGIKMKLANIWWNCAGNGSVAPAPPFGDERVPLLPQYQFLVFQFCIVFPVFCVCSYLAWIQRFTKKKCAVSLRYDQSHLKRQHPCKSYRPQKWDKSNLLRIN